MFVIVIVRFVSVIFSIMFFKKLKKRDGIICFFVVDKMVK